LPVNSFQKVNLSQKSKLYYLCKKSTLSALLILLLLFLVLFLNKRPLFSAIRTFLWLTASFLLITALRTLPDSHAILTSLAFNKGISLIPGELHRQIPMERRLHMTKRLYRSSKDRMLGGVCGGIAAYFSIDPTVIRLFWVIASIFLGMGFGGVVAYLLCLLVIPGEPEENVP
jgi:phage shock protein PspC (stress-responsive transcriptional regulator)